jgi:hypothetical protein
MKSELLLTLACVCTSFPAFAFQCDDDFLMLAFIKHSWGEPVYVLRNRDEEKMSTHKPLYGGKFSITDNPDEKNQRFIEFTLYCWPEDGFKAINCSSSPTNAAEVIYKKGPRSGRTKERAFKELPYSKSAGAYYVCNVGCKENVAPYVFADCPSD